MTTRALVTGHTTNRQGGRGVEISGAIWRGDRAGNLTHAVAKLGRGG